MQTINISDIREETIYQFDCSNCNEFNDTYDTLKVGDTVNCEHCGEEYEISE